MSEETTQLSESEKKKEDWMNSKWRPMMGWMYMLICTFDFVVAPILWSLVQAIYKGGVNVQWQPLTLQGAGLFHIAMGGVLGLAAYGRTQEKLNGANNGGINLPSNVGTTYTPPTAIQPTTPAGFSTPAPAPTTNPLASGFGGSGFGGAPVPVPTQAAGGFGTVATGFGGKPAPVQPPFPAI